MRWRRAAALAASAITHLLIPLAAWLAAPARRPPSARRADASIRVFVVQPVEAPRFPGLQPSDASHERPAASSGLQSLRLGQLDIDLGKIASHADVLFPALTPGLALDSFFPSADRLTFPGVPTAASGRSSKMPASPLVLDDRGVQSVVDQSWARRDRWRAFQVIAELLDTHVPGGSLPQMLREHRRQNALQPYRDRESRDPRLWIQLSLAADHVSLIGFIRTYAAAHPSTGEAAELLLLLDTLVQAEQDVLHLLFATDPAADLELTRTVNPAAYVLLARIRERYRTELARRGLRTNAQVDAYYDQVRQSILGRIIASAATASATEDARFLSGAIQWRAGRRAEAVNTWRALRGQSDGVYAVSCAALRAVMGHDPLDNRAVTRILDVEEDRWLTLSYERLRHFGYRLDTY
jgi:hypothetical protein